MGNIKIKIIHVYLEENMNNLVDNFEKQDAPKDVYHCECCGNDVTEDQWNNRQKMCYTCWFKD